MNKGNPVTDLGGEQPLDVYRRWLARLQRRDPALHQDLMKRLDERMKELRPEFGVGFCAEGITEEGAPDEAFERMVAETIVRDGRPALLVQKDRITFNGVEADGASEEIIGKLRGATQTVEPLLPLVGRIDAANYAGTAPFLGTGWMVDSNIVVTNRHVAELMANSDGSKFVFKPGRLGEKLMVSVDYRREHEVPGQAVARVKRILWIESDARKADIAFLEVEAADDHVVRRHFTLAKEDASDQDPVAVIGYPARASARLIPDQAWMDKIYGGTYEIKRVAPGTMGRGSRGWATHDCTTLGGNSGSVVVDLKTGNAVALHFAGLYMIENYAVPASTIRWYLTKRPWQGNGAIRGRGRTEAPVAPQADRVNRSRRALSLTIPVTIDISVGDLSVGEADMRIGNGVVDGANSSASKVEAAARVFAREFSDDSVLAVRPGALFVAGKLGDKEGLIVSVHPERLSDPTLRLPAQFQGFTVVVGPASIADQLGQSADAPDSEAVASIAYNDKDRTGTGFSFNWVDEEMEVLLHVGPERSWSVLGPFLQETEGKMVSSIYEFHARHIADAIRDQLDHGRALTLVLARQSRNPRSGSIAKGDFDREAVFGDWESTFRDKFENVFVPLGTNGLVANSYHIKVTVRDADAVWLSSGNWKRASQPLIEPDDMNDPRATSGAGNREWHVTLRNGTLADRFRNHIREDFRASVELGGTPEALDTEALVDVPRVLLEGIELEAPPERVIEPLPIGPRKVRVKPLLTPDKQGKVYTDAVLGLIESARKQLVFQNQYIKFAGVTKGNLKKLADALCAKSDEIEDCRVILRSGGDGFWDDMRALRRNGLDVNRCVRRLANTHTKGIVVDGKKVLLGSHNWSSDGVSLNRDASLIFDDREIAQYYLDAFEVDWERANELASDETVEETAPRLAVGDAPPPGFVRMPLSEYLEG